MRRFWKVTDRDGSNRWLIPKGNYSEQLPIPHRTLLLPIIGRDGMFDGHGDFRSPRGQGEASLTFTVIASCPIETEAKLARMFEALYGSTFEQGLRKVWRMNDTDESGQRFTWARLAQHPQMTRDIANVRHMVVSTNLLLPDSTFYEPLRHKWLADNGYTELAVSAATVGETIAPDLLFARFTPTVFPFTFTIENIGDVETKRLIFRITAANLLPSVVVTNSTVGQRFTTPQVAAASILSVNCAPGLGRARSSADSGLTWTDETVSLGLPITQAEIMRLDPGLNTIVLSDVTEPFTLDMWWLHAYRD